MINRPAINLLVRGSAAVALVAALSLSLAAGCAPSVLLDRPADWPDQWRGRNFYNTPSAYIYAGSDAVAGEIDRLASAVGNQFRSQTDAEPTKGLIIVSDPADGEPIADAKWIFETFARQQAQQQGKAPPDAKKLQKTWDDLAARIAEKEIPLDLSTMFLVNPIALDGGRLAGELGLPEGVASTIDWAIAMPSRAMIEKFINTTLGIALESKDISVGQRITLALLRPVLVSTAANSTAKEREIAVFEQMSNSQPGWPDLRKRREAKYYQKLKGKKGQAQFNVAFSRRTAKKANRDPEGGGNAQGGPDARPITP